MESPRLDDALIARFARDAAPLWPDGARLGVAVSGGADSLALLLLAHRARPGMVEAASVDHGLRPQSASEARAVARLCEQLGIAHRILAVEVEPGNLQANARRARYRALERWARARGLDLLATAHHADDQAETLMMRLLRASGLPGLAGIRARTRVPEGELALIRPLLGWRKRELARLVRSAGIEPAEDPSNRDMDFDRARIRAALETAPWIDPLALSQSAAYLADGAEALDWAAALEWEERVERRGKELLYRPRAPRAIRIEVLARAIAQMSGKEPRKGAVARLVERLEGGGAGNLCGVWVTPFPPAGDREPGWLLRSEPARGARD